MEFDDLPPEMVIKIFSYLPLPFLEVISRVSHRWMNLAFDPSLYTRLCIDSGHGDGPQQVQNILERATMLRSLDITSETAYLDVIASVSPGFLLLNTLVIPGSVISHRAMSVIIENCKCVTTIGLCGPHRLAATDIRTLETLPSLKAFVMWEDIIMHDDVLRQLCCSCPRLESLQINANEISRNETWDYLGGLHHLRVLAVNVISTTGLLHVSQSCPGLKTLEIGDVLNENISMAQALQGFLELTSLYVYLDCGDGWLNGQFRIPPLLQSFKVTRLVLEEEQFDRLILSLGETLQHISINVSMIPDESLRQLSSCKNVQSLRMYGLRGDTIVFSLLCQLPRVTRVYLYIVSDPAGSIYQLMSIVDTLDKSPRGKTRLVCNVFCSLQDSQGNVTRASSAFTNFLALNTSMTMEHILEFEEQCQKACEVTGPPWKVETSFPTLSPTLKCLTLDLDGV